MKSLTRLTAAPLLCLLSACGSATAGSADSNESVAAPITSNSVGATPIADPSAYKIGTVLNSVLYYDGGRPFMNLVYGGATVMASSGAPSDIPSEYLDANGWVKALPAGYRALRQISIPVAGGDFICRYQGNGSLQVNGGTNVSSSAGQTRFTYPVGYPGRHWLTIQWEVDPSNYIRNIDCREANASATDVFAQEYLTALRGFNTARFIKWQPAVEANTKVTWATRNKPGDADYVRNDGVPVEVMVQLAAQAGADPWFNIPWNADDDYITRFATYVRDNLPADRKVYVENSNEVWNWAYPVTAQALKEGKDENLPGETGGDFQIIIERYAEKTQHVMDIWSNVFAGQTNRLVRVAAFQNVQPFYSEMLLTFKDTYKHVDALATAPYFGFGPNDYPNLTVDLAFSTALPNAISDTLKHAAQNKQIATKYGLRYVTYEGGQGIELPNNVPLLEQIERDPRMYDMYKSYITQWQSQMGDLLQLMQFVGPITQWGAWGMAEYAGQPLDQTPKMRAVREFLGTATATSTTTTTQVCVDGSIIPVTSTCPTPTTSTGSTSDVVTTPTDSTSGGTTTGKSKGVGKGTGRGSGKGNVAVA